MAMTAVGKESSCLSWLMCAASESDVESGLKNRVYPDCQMLPSLYVLAVNVVIFVCSLFWNYPALSIVSVPAILCSLFLVYVTQNIQNLITFSESNEILKGSILTLEKENEALQAKLDFFEGENKKLQEANKNLAELIENFRKENLSLTEANQALQRNVADLQRLKVMLEEKAGAHVKQLEDLKDSLGGIESSATENHKNFSSNLNSFIQEIQRLQDTRQNFESTGSAIEEKMKQQVDILLKTTDVLKKIFKKVNNWKDKKKNERQIARQEEWTQKLIGLERHIAAREVQLKVEESHLDELKKIKSGFSSALDNLLEKIEQIDGVKTELAEEVKKAAVIFKAQAHALTN